MTTLERTWLAGVTAASLAAPAVRAEITDWAPVVGPPPRESMNVNPNKSVFWPQLATLTAADSSNPKLYAAWGELGGSTGSLRQVRVAVYNGDNNAPAWSRVDTRMNGMTRSASQGINFNPKLSVDGGVSLVEHKGSLYAAWPEGDNYVYRIRVARYDAGANPGWVSVDGATKNGLNFSGSKSAKEPQLVSFNGKLYAFWVEQGQLRARVYNDADKTWSWVDGGRSSGLNIDPTMDVRTLAAVPGVRSGTQDKLYLGFIENNASYVGQVRVKVFSEINGVKKWELADGGNELNCDPSTGATELLADLEAAADQNGIYFAWSETAFSEIADPGTPSPKQVRIVHSDGSINWRPLDGDNPVAGLNLDATKNAYVRDLQTIGGKVYLMWAEDTSIRAAVGLWGSAGEFVWTQVDGEGLRGNVQVNEAAAGQDASFGVLGGQLFAFTIEGPFDALKTGYVSVGIEPAPAP